MLAIKDLFENQPIALVYFPSIRCLALSQHSAASEGSWKFISPSLISLSLQILSARWSLFGHILRRDKDIPANEATRAFFIPNGNKLRGRPKTTLPSVLNRDLSLIQDPIRLHSSKDLAEITEPAQDRKCWRGLTSRIEKAAEVSQTKNWDAKRQ